MKERSRFLITLLAPCVAVALVACSPDVKVKAVAGCLASACHQETESMHPWQALSCVECHGGDDTAVQKAQAHIARPAGFGPFPLTAGTHANNEQFLRGPMMSHDLSDPDILAFRRFLNPGDMHIVDKTCGREGACHADLTPKVTNSLHGTNAGLNSGVLYINGLRPQFADSDGSDNDKKAFIAAHLPNGTPLTDPNYDSSIAGTVESITVSPPLDDVSVRDLDQVPLDNTFLKNMWISFLNDDCQRCHIWNEGIKRPGDFRSSGCSACHVYYRNDGLSVSTDQTILKTETDHPATHEMQLYPTDEQCSHCHSRGARHGLEIMGIRERPQGWRDILFNEHGQNTRTNDAEVAGGRTGGFFPDNPSFFLAKAAAAALTIPRAGDLMHGVEYEGKKIWGRDTGRDDGNNYLIRDEDSTNDVDETPPDLHLARGMGCVDCHTSNESHGDGRIYTDRYHEVEIECESCHGTPANESALVTRKGEPVGGLFRDEADGLIYQTLKSNGEVRRVMQVKAVVTNDGNQDYNAKAVDGCGQHVTFDDAGKAVDERARLECSSCHSTWALNCSSCHMMIDYSNDISKHQDFATSLLDNVTRPGLQVQERFATSHDQLILGINKRGRIGPFTMSGQAAQYAVTKTGARNADGEFVPENFVADPGFANGDTTNQYVSNWLLTTVDDGKHLPSMPFNAVYPHTTQSLPRNCDACHPKPGATQAELELVDKVVGLGNGLRRSGGDPAQRISTIRVFADPSSPDTTKVSNPFNYATGPLKDLVFSYREILIRRDGLRLFTGDSGDVLDATDYQGVAMEDGDIVSINIDEFVDYVFRIGGQDYNTRDTIPTYGPGIEVISVEQKRPTSHVNTGPLDVRGMNGVLQNEVDAQERTPE